MVFTPMPPSGLITLTTDFGTTDIYVGVMKGVIFNINQQAHIVDVTHAVPPQDIHAAGFLIDAAYTYFPVGTIHVIVVDPGVGSRRRAIVCQTETACFVCPDNGVLSHVLRDNPPYRAVAIENTAYCLPQISNTFHGRDIFAPAAAHLSAGIEIHQLGQQITDLIRFPVPTADVTEASIVGHVIWVDGFGNLITNISYDRLESFGVQSDAIIRAGTVEITHLSRSYAESAPGDVLAIIGSFGRLEISVNRGNAAQTLGLERGDAITVRHATPKLHQ